MGQCFELRNRHHIFISGSESKKKKEEKEEMKEEQLGQPQIQTINRKIMYLDAAMVGPRVNPGMASRSSLPLF